MYVMLCVYMCVMYVRMLCYASKLCTYAMCYVCTLGMLGMYVVHVRYECALRMYITHDMHACFVCIICM